MQKKKERKIERLEDLKRSELIHIIKVYNKQNIIKNYHKMNKSQLIEHINKHIILSQDFKTVKPKQNETKLISVSKYDKLMKEEKEAKTEKDIKALYKAFGGLKAQLLLLQKKKKEYDENYNSDKKLGNNVMWVAEYKDLEDDIKVSKDKLINIRNKIKLLDEKQQEKEETSKKAKEELREVKKNIKDKVGKNKIDEYIKIIEQNEKKMKEEDIKIKKIDEEVKQFEELMKKPILKVEPKKKEVEKMNQKQQEIYNFIQEEKKNLNVKLKDDEIKQLILLGDNPYIIGFINYLVNKGYKFNDIIKYNDDIKDIVFSAYQLAEQNNNLFSVDEVFEHGIKLLIEDMEPTDDFNPRYIINDLEKVLKDIKKR